LNHCPQQRLHGQLLVRATFGDRNFVATFASADLLDAVVRQQFFACLDRQLGVREWLEASVIVRLFGIALIVA
jgi:hypothetical protein